MEESLAFFDDLILSESEHITREIFPAVAIGIVWYTPSEAIDQAVRLEIAADIFRKGLASLKGTGGVLKKQRIEMMTGFANFVAYCGNELKQHVNGVIKYLPMDKKQIKKTLSVKNNG
jgi:hypothetical protein